MLVFFSQGKPASSPSSTCTPQVSRQGHLPWILGCRPCSGANRSVMGRPAWACRLQGSLGPTGLPLFLGKPLHWEQEADLPTGSTNPPGEETKQAAGHAAVSGKCPASSPADICPHSSPLPPCWPCRQQPSATQPVASGPILGQSPKVFTLNEI